MLASKASALAIVRLIALARPRTKTRVEDRSLILITARQSQAPRNRAPWNHRTQSVRTIQEVKRQMKRIGWDLCSIPKAKYRAVRSLTGASTKAQWLAWAAWVAIIARVEPDWQRRWWPSCAKTSKRNSKRRSKKSKRCYLISKTPKSTAWSLHRSNHCARNSQHQAKRLTQNKQSWQRHCRRRRIRCRHYKQNSHRSRKRFRKSCTISKINRTAMR